MLFQLFCAVLLPVFFSTASAAYPDRPREEQKRLYHMLDLITDQEAERAAEFSQQADQHDVADIELAIKPFGPE